MSKKNHKKTLILNKTSCISCGGCVGLCPHFALDMYDIDLQIFQDACTYCTLCVRICPVGALHIEE